MIGEETQVIDFEIDWEAINDVYFDYLEDKRRRYQIFFGGSSSGKSYFLSQRALLDIMNGGRNYLVCRRKANTIRHSVFKEITKLISNWGISHLFKINKSEMSITCSNGYQILFAGLDDVEKLKSFTAEKGQITTIWVEEATEISKDDMKTLDKRLRGMDVFSDEEQEDKEFILSFNPMLKSNWIYKDFFTSIAWAEDQTEFINDTLSIIKTWHVDNDFLTTEDHADLENETDDYYYQVYTLGNWGVLGQVIFKPYSIGSDGKESGVWSMSDLSDRIPEFDNIFDGLDFGFANDPVAYIKAHHDKKRKIIYIFHEEGGIEWDDEYTAEIVGPHVGGRPLLCDTEPKSIKKLKSLGIKAKSAKKGPDSIRYGIKWLKGYRIIIHTTCIRTRQEIEMYQWKKDKYGDVMPVPIDKNNHWIDALRYAFSLIMEEKTKSGFVDVKGL